MQGFNEIHRKMTGVMPIRGPDKVVKEGVKLLNIDSTKPLSEDERRQLKTLIHRINILLRSIREDLDSMKEVLKT